MKASTVYEVIAHTAVASEALMWARFYNYLMANSILLLAWATLYAPDIKARPRGVAVALGLLSLAGVFLGLVSAAMGHRGRKGTDVWLREGQRLECRADWPKELDSSRVFHRALALRHEIPFALSGSTYVLPGIPLAFSLIFGVLFFLSWLYR